MQAKNTLPSRPQRVTFHLKRHYGVVVMMNCAYVSVQFAKLYISVCTCDIIPVTKAANMPTISKTLPRLQVISGLLSDISLYCPHFT